MRSVTVDLLICGGFSFFFFGDYFVWKQEMQHNSIAPKRSHHTLRHDTAALIAQSKTKQDRVSLVSNEAVIVFDERTAL